MAYHGSRRPKVVVPDVALRGRAMLDARGAMVLDSAYALRPITDRLSHELLLALLNSRIVELWLRETGIPLRGGYVRLKTAYLAALPVPGSSRSTERIEDLIRRRDQPDPAEVDDLVREAYGVPPTDWYDR
jgi:hypothetical protein